MKRSILLLCLSLAPSTSFAASLLQPGNFIIAIDTSPVPSSSSPMTEGPTNAFDGNSATKYLNFGEERSGFIITPSGGSSIVQSFILTTANDADVRDPASYSLYGTNSPIASANHGFGDGEPWTLIQSGGLSLPVTRQTAGSAVDVSGAVPYSSYRMVFNTVKNATSANSMQIGDVQFFTGTGGTGSTLLSALDSIRAFDFDALSYPTTEGPANAINGTTAKFLHFGEAGSGFITTPSVGPSVVTSFEITTAGDVEARDPASYSIYGTNSPISSTDNSTGGGEPWTLIQAGALSLPAARNTLGGMVPVTNSTAYNSYRVVFDSVKDGAAANSMQIAEIQFFGDVVPEPSAVLMLIGAVFPLLARRRRH